MGHPVLILNIKSKIDTLELIAPPKISKCSSIANQVGSDIGLLHWDAPLKLSDSVTDYVVHVRRMSPQPERADREFASPRTTFVLEVTSMLSKLAGNSIF